MIRWHWMLLGNQAISPGLRVLTYKSVPGGILSDCLPVTEAVDCLLQSQALLQASTNARSQGAPRLVFLSALTRRRAWNIKHPELLQTDSKACLLEMGPDWDYLLPRNWQMPQIGASPSTVSRELLFSTAKGIQVIPLPQASENLERTDREKCLSFLYSQF